MSSMLLMSSDPLGADLPVPNEEVVELEGVRVRTTTVRALDVGDPLVAERDAILLFPAGAMSLRTMQRLRLARRIGYVVIGRRIYYRYSDLQRYIENHRIHPRR